MIHIITSLTHNGRGRERHLSYFVKPPIQPASCRNSSLSATLAGRVNFARAYVSQPELVVGVVHQKVLEAFWDGPDTFPTRVVVDDVLN